jgi:hypothetical protein
MGPATLDAVEARLADKMSSTGSIDRPSWVPQLPRPPSYSPNKHRASQIRSTLGLGQRDADFWLSSWHRSAGNRAVHEPHVDAVLAWTTDAAAALGPSARPLSGLIRRTVCRLAGADPSNANVP